MMQGPQGVIAVTLILIAFAVYFMLSVLVSYTDLCLHFLNCEFSLQIYIWSSLEWYLINGTE